MDAPSVSSSTASTSSVPTRASPISAPSSGQHEDAVGADHSSPPPTSSPDAPSLLLHPSAEERRSLDNDVGKRRKEARAVWRKDVSASSPPALAVVTGTYRPPPPSEAHALGQPSSVRAATSTSQSHSSSGRSTSSSNSQSSSVRSAVASLQSSSSSGRPTSSNSQFSSASAEASSSSSSSDARVSGPLLRHLRAFAETARDLHSSYREVVRYFEVGLPESTLLDFQLDLSRRIADRHTKAAKR